MEIDFCETQSNFDHLFYHDQNYKVLLCCILYMGLGLAFPLTGIFCFAIIVVFMSQNVNLAKTSLKYHFVNNTQLYDFLLFQFFMVLLLNLGILVFFYRMFRIQTLLFYAILFFAMLMIAMAVSKFSTDLFTGTIYMHIHNKRTMDKIMKQV